MVLLVPYLQHVPESFWTECLLQVVVVCCLRPTSAGFDVGDVSLTDSLSLEVCMGIICVSQNCAEFWKLCFCAGTEVSEGLVRSSSSQTQVTVSGHSEDRSVS